MVARASSRLRRVQRLSAPGEDLGSVKPDTVGIRGIDVFRQPVEFLRDPVRLRFEHRHPAEHEIPLIGVGRRAGIVEVQKVHGGFQDGNRGATRMRPGEPTGSTDRRGSDRDRDVRARSSRRRAPPAAVACERPWPPPCRQDEPAGSVIAVSRFSTQRVLIEMRGKSKRHEPMTSEDYQPVPTAG